MKAFKDPISWCVLFNCSITRRKMWKYRKRWIGINIDFYLSSMFNMWNKICRTYNLSGFMFWLKSFVDLAFNQILYIDFGMQNNIYHNFCLILLAIETVEKLNFVLNLWILDFHKFMKAILPDSDPHCSFSVCFNWFSDSIYI